MHTRQLRRSWQPCVWIAAFTSAFLGGALLSPWAFSSPPHASPPPTSPPPTSPPPTSRPSSQPSVPTPLQRVDALLRSLERGFLDRSSAIFDGLSLDLQQGLSPQEFRPILQRLVALLDHPKIEIRRRAHNVLLLASKRAIPLLKEAMKTDNWRLRANLLGVLGRLIKDHQALAPLLAASSFDPHPLVRLFAARLIQMQFLPSSRIVQDAIRVLELPTPTPAKSVALSLLEREGASFYTPSHFSNAQALTSYEAKRLILLFRKGEDLPTSSLVTFSRNNLPLLRKHAYLLLAQKKSLSLLPHLLKALRDPALLHASDELWASLRSYHDLSDADFAPFAPFLFSPLPRQSLHAARFLLEQTKVSSAFLFLALQSPHPETLDELLSSLSKAKLSLFLPSLRAFLNHPDTSVRVAASFGLLHFQPADKDALRSIRSAWQSHTAPLLSEPSKSILLRIFAKILDSWPHSQPLLPLLREGMRHPHPTIRDASFQTFRRLKHHPKSIFR